MSISEAIGHLEAVRAVLAAEVARRVALETDWDAELESLADGSR